MIFFPYFHFFNALVFLYLAVSVVVKNPGARLNRVASCCLLSLFTWNFSMVIMHNTGVSKSVARLFMDISAFGWVSAAALYVWLMLIFAGKTKILKAKWFYPLLFFFPAFFIFLQFSKFIYVDLIKVYFGWKPVYSGSIWPYFFFAYYIAFMLVGLYINYRVIREASNTLQKKQAVVTLIATAVSFFLVSVTDVALPFSGNHTIPNIGGALSLIWAFGLVYSMIKYKFLAITPATAAGNIISTMFDCLLLLSVEGDITTVNQATLKLLGYKENEIKGKRVDILFTREGITGGLVDQIVSHIPFKNRDVLLRAKDGKGVPVLFASSLLKDDEDQVAGIVCVAKDISERKKLEEEILKSKKLESIGILAGGIAHDFNNLLSVLIGNLTLAMEEMSPGNTSYKLLVKVEEASLKAADLAEKFITFSKDGWLKKRKIELSPLLRNVKELEIPAKTIAYYYDVPSDLMHILGDETQLKQVFQNLFINAVEAVSEGGEIIVQAENIIVEEATALIEKGKYVKVLIRDNGKGIPGDIIEKIFDPYFSTKKETNRKGLGLGLTLCHAIITKHGGKITIDSEEGEGTWVTLYLPATE